MAPQPYFAGGWPLKAVSCKAEEAWLSPLQLCIPTMLCSQYAHRLPCSEVSLLPSPVLTRGPFWRHEWPQAGRALGASNSSQTGFSYSATRDPSTSVPTFEAHQSPQTVEGEKSLEPLGLPQSQR